MTPRPLPGPEIYNGIEAMNLPDDRQGWHSDHPIFKKLIDEIKPQTIIEVGTWKGASAIHMAGLAPEAKIYCVDTWFGGIDHDVNQEVATSVIPRDDHGYPHLYHQFLANVARAGHQSRIVPIVQTSVNGARLLAAHGIKADLIYVDGSHEFPDALIDMDNYWNLCLRPGGVMFGDDMGFPGVSQSVAKFATHTGETVEVVAQNFWMFRKPLIVAK